MAFRRMSFIGVCLSSLALPWAVRPAQACGGMFCDGGTQAMPVDQTGENILFVMDGDRVAAHIQIQYDPNTDASKFAWVLPLQALPEFSVGSQPLFDALLQASVPTYGFTVTRDSCGSQSGGSRGTGDGFGGESGSSAGDEGGGGDPDVVYQASVGAFEVAVLEGGTVEGVMTWLGDNGYTQDPAAEPILGEYLAEGFLFAAFKLTTGAGLDQIHPVVLTFANEEACVPLRLTRIAAVEDLEVRTFFLAAHRVVPRTYRHVLVNPLKIDWLNLAANYKDVITQAVDSEHADGRAFVTEYAGTSAMVPTAAISNPAWDAVALATTPVVDVVTELTNQGLVSCYHDTLPVRSTCTFFHPLIESLLAQYMPAPAGLTPYDFWSCLSCYEAQIDAQTWDAAAFSAAMAERVVDPGTAAVQALATHPYLTRMYTTISPGEMTADPFFYENPDLPEVANRQIGAQRIMCDGDSLFTLPDGRVVYVPEGASWPEFDDEMPWAEEVDEMLPSGSPANLVDNTALIDRLLDRYNEPFLDCNCSTPVGGSWLAGLALLGLRRRRLKSP